jgi:hypothetical protein
MNALVKDPAAKVMPPIRSEMANRVGIYSLRRTLPEFCFEDRLAELLKFVELARIDEVILKIDSEEWSQGHPTLEWAEAYVKLLEHARYALRNRGVLLSLNPWVSIGHNERGRDLRDRFPNFTWMVGHDGGESRAVACPLCPEWQSHAAKLWKLYSRLEPNVFWIEDDIRMFNHSPLKFGCFCRRHLRAFSARVGSEVSREELLRTIVAPGRPHPWRSLWLDTLREGVEQACELLAQAVWSVSPHTSMGLMSSGVEYHALDGREWDVLRRILSGPRSLPVHSRPTLGNYRETELTGLYTCAAEIQRTRHLFPGCIEQTEIENFPFSAYTKSATFTWLQGAVSLAFGSHGVTLNLFDHMGTPIDQLHPEMDSMLRERLPFLDALRQAHSPEGIFRGIRIFCDGRDSRCRELAKEEGYADLQQLNYRWERVLNSLGYPTTYEESATVCATDGQRIASLKDEDLLQLLSGGLLLDLEAAHVVIRRGFGRHLGIQFDGTGIVNEQEITCAEELDETPLRADRWMSLTMVGLRGDVEFGKVRAGGECRIWSWLVDENRRRKQPFLCSYENELGGRVAVLPMKLGNVEERYLLSPQRRRQLGAVLSWLSGGPLDAAVTGGVYPLAYRIDCPGRILLGIFNLSHDAWPAVDWSLAWNEGTSLLQIAELRGDGTWKEFSGTFSFEAGILSLHSERPLTFDLPLILELTTAPIPN